MENSFKEKLFNCFEANLGPYTCPRCTNFRTNLLLVLIRHIKENHTEQDEHCRLSLCEKCGFETWSQFLIIRHRNLDTCVEKSRLVHGDNSHLRHDHCYYNETHTNSLVKWLICVDCSYKTKNRQKFQLHQNRQVCKRMLEKRMQCQYCHFKTRYKKCLMRHEYFQHVKWLVEDKVKHKPNLLRHQKNSKEAVLDVAPSYEQFVKQRFQVKKREKKVWFCGTCSFTTKSEKYLKRHYDTVHVNMTVEQVKWFQCGQCSYKSKTMKGLREHGTCYKKTPRQQCNVASIEDSLFFCKECSFKTNSINNLDNHFEEIHMPKLLGVEWFQCGQCSHQSNTLRDLTVHQNCEHIAVVVLK